MDANIVYIFMFNQYYNGKPVKQGERITIDGTNKNEVVQIRVLLSQKRIRAVKINEENNVQELTVRESGQLHNDIKKTLTSKENKIAKVANVIKEKVKAKTPVKKKAKAKK